MTQILIENSLLVPDPLVVDYKTGQSILVEGSTISKIGASSGLRQAYPNAERVDGSGMLLLPGLVDLHTHLYAALTTGMPSAGAPPQNFPQVLKGMWWLWDKALHAEDISISATAGCIASLRCGITTLFDHLASPSAVEGSLSLQAEAIEKVGLRACLSYEVSDRNGPASFAEGVAENRRFIVENKKRQDNLIRALFGLHAVYSLSDDSLRRCAGEGAELDTGFHMHMMEHLAEVYKFAETHSRSIPEFLAEIGILGPKTVLAHTVHVKPSDIEILKTTGTSNAHNPHSNAGNGVGICPVTSMLAAGQNIGLGSDGFYDLPFEMELARLLQSTANANPSAFSGSQALQMVYRNNVCFAERIFGCKLGKVEPGYTADLILIAYNPPTPIYPENLGSHILAALMSCQVKTALVNGRIVLRDGLLPQMDEARIIAQARTAAGKIWKRFAESA